MTCAPLDEASQKKEENIGPPARGFRVWWGVGPRPETIDK